MICSHKKVQKYIASIVFCTLLCGNSATQAVLFDATIKNFIDAASKETRSVLASDVYPQAIRLVKQSAVALVGVAFCSYGLSLFVSQCEKKKVFADGRRICTASILLALGGSMVLFSDRLVRRI
jgi:hypothetical protein